MVGNLLFMGAGTLLLLVALSEGRTSRERALAAVGFLAAGAAVLVQR